jgi:hypothetical protein
MASFTTEDQPYSSEHYSLDFSDAVEKVHHLHSLTIQLHVDKS